MHLTTPFDRRGRELRLQARPLLVLSRVCYTGSHNNKNQTKKPFTQIALQNPRFHHDHHVSLAPSIHSVWRVFPNTAGSQLFLASGLPCAFVANHVYLWLYALLQRPTFVQELIALSGKLLTVSAACCAKLTHRYFARLWVVMSQCFKRYYDLIRRSLELPATYGLSRRVFALPLSESPSLLCLVRPAPVATIHTPSGKRAVFDDSLSTLRLSSRRIEPLQP
jgi:hypothetical protein